MKIQIPNQVKDYIDINLLTEGELMFTSFMHMVMTRYGWNTRYNMNAGDIRRILYNMNGNYVALFGHKTENLRKIFEFAQTDEYNILVAFRDIKPKGAFGRPIDTKGSKLTIGSEEVELKDLKSIKLWCYLMGLWFSGTEIVTESNSILEYLDNNRVMEHLERKNFKIE